MRITDTKEFEEFKNIVLDMLKDERIEFSVREEYWNKIMEWIDTCEYCRDVYCEYCGVQEKSCCHDCEDLDEE